MPYTPSPQDNHILVALPDGATQPASVDALVASVYDDVDPRLHPVAKSSLLAHLLKLEQEGRVLRDSADINAPWSLPRL